MADAFEHERRTTIETAGFYVVLCGYVAIAMTCALAAPVGKFDDALILLHGTLTQLGFRPQCGLLLVLSSAEPPLDCRRVQPCRSHGHRQPHGRQCLLSDSRAARGVLLSCPLSLVGSARSGSGSCCGEQYRQRDQPSSLARLCAGSVAAPGDASACAGGRTTPSVACRRFGRADRPGAPVQNQFRWVCPGGHSDRFPNDGGSTAGIEDTSVSRVS